MNQSRLYLFYAQLTSKQVKAFRDFVASPFFNKKPYLIILNEQCEKAIFKGKQAIDKQAVYKLMYPQNAYNDQKMRLAMSNLLKLLEQFVAHQGLLEDEFASKLRVLEYCRQRQLPKHFDYTLRSLKSMHKNQQTRNAIYYENRFQLLQEEFLQHYAERRGGAHNLQEVDEMIDLAYLSRKLQQTCYFLSRQTVWKGTINHGMLDAACAFIQQKDLLHVPAIAVYYHAFQALKQPKDEASFFALKQAIISSGAAFPTAEIQGLYLLALNFCIRRGNEGQRNYFSEGLDLYKQGLAQGYLLTDGELNHFTFNNAVAMSLKIANYDWAEAFIESNQHLLNKKYREHAVSYSLARLAYARKDYDTALPLLQKVAYKDLLTSLNAKTILMEIYWAMEELELLNAHLDAFQIYLRRKSVIGYHRKNYENVIRFGRKLLNLNHFDKQEVASFQQAVIEEEVLSNRNWFLEQVGKF